MTFNPGRWRDDHGPDSIEGMDRYSRRDLEADLSEAVLDELSEAVGRYVRVAAMLEIALFKVLSDLDPDHWTFDKAEWDLGPTRTIGKLRELADRLDRTVHWRRRFESLLDDAEGFVSLRNGVVHGSYHRHSSGVWESRRWIRDRKTGTARLERVEYDRASLLRSTMLAANCSADLLDIRPRVAPHLGVHREWLFR